MSSTGADATALQLPLLFARPDTGEPLRDAHLDLHITPEVFDEVILVELGRSLDHFKVPNREKEEVLGAIKAQKKDLTAGSTSGSRA